VDEFAAWLKTTVWQNRRGTIYRFPEKDVVLITKKLGVGGKYEMIIEEVGVMTWTWTTGAKAKATIDADLKSAIVAGGLPLARLEAE